jgi:hypothetical protein
MGEESPIRDSCKSSLSSSIEAFRCSCLFLPIDFMDMISTDSIVKLSVLNSSYSLINGFKISLSSIGSLFKSQQICNEWINLHILDKLVEII